MTTAWGSNTCILCGFTESNATINSDDTDPDIVRDLYPTGAPLLFMNRQNILKQLNFGVGNLLQK
jgi:hypothetical protein